MMPTELIFNLLKNTLDPQLIYEATESLQSLKTSKGFSISLILISSQNQIDELFKMPALVYLKNLIQLQCKNQNTIIIDHEEFKQVKQSIFPMLIKAIQKNQKKLLPTLKQICFLFAKYFYKENQWECITPLLLNHLESCQSFEVVQATLIIIKILFQVIGNTLSLQNKLNDLSNQIMLPLVSVASKISADLSEFSCTWLEEIFRIFTEAIQFHLPQIIQKNVQLFMVLIKNVLDLKDDINPKNQQFLRIMKIKKEVLKFLQKMYQRHASSNLTRQQKFWIEFHKKYTKSFFQTIARIMESLTSISQKESFSQNLLNLNFIMVGHALGIFSSFVNLKLSITFMAQEEREKYQPKIILLGMQNFLNCHSRPLSQKLKMISQMSTKYDNLFSNYSEFINIFEEERQALKQLLSNIFQNKTQSKEKTIEQTFQLLIHCILQGSFKEKELALHLLSNLEQEIQLLHSQTNPNIYQTIIVLFKSYVFQMLTFTTSDLNALDYFYAQLIRLRAFKIYKKFQFLELGQPHYIKVCEKIYSQMNQFEQNQMDFFIKIQTLQTFNQILQKDNQLISKVSNSIPMILRIYTNLLARDFEVIKFYDQILKLFADYITPIVHELLELLANTFFKLNKQKSAKFNCLSFQHKYQNNNQNQLDQQNDRIDDLETIQQGSDNETIYEDLTQKYGNIGSQCLASIKRLIFKHDISSQFSQEAAKLKEKLLLLTIHALSTNDEQFIQSGLGILNLLLYKNYFSGHYHCLLPALLYPIYHCFDPQLASRFMDRIKSLSASMQTINESQTADQSVDFRSSYFELLKLICNSSISRPFSICDSVGCIKNFIKILGDQLASLTCPFLNKSYLSMLVESVMLVQQNQKNQTFSQNQIISILSVYEVLLQQKVFDKIKASMQSLQLYKQAILIKNTNLAQLYLNFEFLVRNELKWNILIEGSWLNSTTKQKLQKFYFRLLMITVCTYPAQFLMVFKTEAIGLNAYSLKSSSISEIEKVCQQLQKFILNKAISLFSSLQNIKEDSFDQLNQFFITFYASNELIKLLAHSFILNGSPLECIQQKFDLLTGKIRGFFLRLNFISIKLLLFIMISNFKLFDKESYKQALNCLSIQKFLKCLDDMILSGSSSSEIQNNLEPPNSNYFETLANLFNGLNISDLNHQGCQIHHQLLLSRNQSVSMSRENYQQSFHYEQPFSKVELNLDGESQFQQNLSWQNQQDLNPFESAQEEHLCAYDSPIFGGYSTQKKEMLLRNITKVLKNIIDNSPELISFQKLFKLAC